LVRRGDHRGVPPSTPSCYFSGLSLTRNTTRAHPPGKRLPPICRCVGSGDGVARHALGHNRNRWAYGGPPRARRDPPTPAGRGPGPTMYHDMWWPYRASTVRITEVRTIRMSGNEGPRDGTAPTNVPILREGVASYLADSDPEETQEWMDSLDGLLAEA